MEKDVQVFSASVVFAELCQLPMELKLILQVVSNKYENSNEKATQYHACSLWPNRYEWLR